MLLDKPSFKRVFVTNSKCFRINATVFNFNHQHHTFLGPLVQSHLLIHLQCPLVRCLVPPNHHRRKGLQSPQLGRSPTTATSRCTFIVDSLLRLTKVQRIPSFKHIYVNNIKKLLSFTSSYISLIFDTRHFGIQYSSLFYKTNLCI